MRLGDYAGAEGGFRAAIDGMLQHKRAEDDDAIIEMSLKLTECYRHLHQSAEIIAEGLHWFALFFFLFSFTNTTNTAENWYCRCVDRSGRKVMATKTPTANILALYGLSLSMLGKHHLDTGHYPEARRVLEESLRQIDRMQAAAPVCGLCARKTPALEALSPTKQAHMPLQEVSVADPRPDVLGSLAQACFHMGDSPTALELTQGALDLAVRRRAFADAAVLASNMAVFSVADTFWEQADTLAAQSQSSEAMRAVAQQRADMTRLHAANSNTNG
jgi:hypothetical protein